MKTRQGCLSIYLGFLPLLLLPLQSNARIHFKPYGFIKASLARSDNRVNSFGSSGGGFKSPTEAANQSTDVAPPASGTMENQYSIQSSQTRFGASAQSDNLKAVIEMDAAGVNGSSSTDVKVRFRQAFVTYQINDFTLTGGQKWVLFSGLNPFTMNWVAVALRSGNSGFIGNELGLGFKLKYFRLDFNLGNKGANTTSDTNQVELGSPLMTGHLSYSWNGDTWKGKGALLATYGKLKYSKLSDSNEDSVIRGYKFYIQSKIHALELKAEYFWGDNLGSAGYKTLASAEASNSTSFGEKGYFLSMRYNLSPFEITLGHGKDKVDEKELFSQTDLVDNQHTRLGLSYTLQSQLKTFLFMENFKSGYLNSNSQIDYSKAQVLELGLFYKF